MKIKHFFSSPKSSVATAGLVKPEHWNADHVVETVLEGVVLGRKIGDSAGPVEELPIKVSTVSAMFDALTGLFRFPRGNTAQRPTSDVEAGDIRFNTELNRLEAWNGAFWDRIALGDISFLGALEFSFVQTEPDGWMFFSGSFGRTGSATTHPRDDSLNLYNLLWGYGDASPFLMTDTAPRGASAETDWDAGRGITFPDWRGRVFAMSEGMLPAPLNQVISSGATGGFAVGAGLWSTGGAKSHVLTVPELPEHQHGLPDPLRIASRGNLGGAGSGSPINFDTGIIPDNYLKTEVAGEDAAHNTVQPTVQLNCFVKL